MSFSAMVDLDQGTACGGYTYEVEYGPSGSLSNPDLSHYSVANSLAIEGTANTVEWIGTHYLRLKCINGQYDASPTARGVNGLFTHVYSNEIELNFSHPCANSVVNQDA